MFLLPVADWIGLWLGLEVLQMTYITMILNKVHIIKYHDQLPDNDQLLDHGDHDHEGGVAGAPGGDQQGPSNAMVNTI